MKRVSVRFKDSGLPIERLGESAAAREDREAQKKMSKLRIGKPDASNRSKISKNGVPGRT